MFFFGRHLMLTLIFNTIGTLTTDLLAAVSLSSRRKKQLTFCTEIRKQFNQISKFVFKGSIFQLV